MGWLVNTTQTIYNGSIVCPCGKVLTPLEAMYGSDCQQCRANKVRDLIQNGMVAGS